MKICGAGLGIIGGSVCLALKRAGYIVDGWNRSPLPLEYALNNGVYALNSNYFAHGFFVCHNNIAIAVLAVT